MKDKVTDNADKRDDRVAAVRTRGALLADLQALLSDFRQVGRAKFWIALSMLILGSLAEGVSILMLLPVLSLVMREGDNTGLLNLGDLEFGGISFPDISVSLLMILSVFVGFVMLQVLFNRIKSIYLSDLMFSFVNAKRLGLFKAIAVARWDRIIRMAGSELEHALTSEVDRIATGGMLLLTILQSFVLLGVYLCLSFATSPEMTFIMIAFGLVAFLVMRPFRARAADFGEKLQLSRQQQFKTVGDFLGGLKSARATNSEGNYYARFANLLSHNKRDARDYARHTATGSGLFQVLTTIGAALFILIAVNWLALEVARIVVLLLLAMRIAPRFLGIQSQLQQLLVDIPAWRQVSQVEERLFAMRDDSVGRGKPVEPLERGIELYEVTYSYDLLERPAINQISFTVAAKEVTALIGASGSGKSTLADLVTGLVRPQEGCLFFDGRVLSPEELRGWRDRIAYVSQDSVMFNGTIKDNLVATLRHIPAEEELWAALSQSYADRFVKQLPMGLETEIGDRGVRISGGERQRIALARAFLRRPDFLVLDEATSALDWAAQQHVANAVHDLAQSGVTVLTIAHRPSMVAFADTIFTLHEGKVIEQGKRVDLEKDPQSSFSGMLLAEKHN